MRRASGWLLLALLLGAGLIYALVQWWSGPQILLVSVTTGDMVQTMVASGHVQNPHRIDISTQITSTVESVAVEEGQRVEKDQLLLSLDSQEARANLLMAEAATQEARARLQQLREVSEPVAALAQLQALATVKINELNVARSQALLDQAFIAQSVNDEAQRQLIIARAQSLINQKQWLSLQSRGSEISAAEFVLQQALANVASAKAKLSYTRIKSPRSGVLIARHVEAGDSVQAGKPLLVLSPDGQAELVVLLDEKNLKWVRNGQPALAAADAYPEQVFAAQVNFINPGIDPLRGSVEVRLKALRVPDFLTQDMTVTVDIEVDRRVDVMRVPVSAVHGTNKASPWVLLFQAPIAVKTPVKLGLIGREVVQILSGLKPGDQLVPVSETGVSEGTRLRAVTP